MKRYYAKIYAKHICRIIKAFGEGREIQRNTETLFRGWGTVEELNVDDLTQHPELYRIVRRRKCADAH